MLALYHIGARQSIITYFITFLVADIIIVERWDIMGICGGLVVIFVVWIFGKAALHWVYLPEALDTQIQSASSASQYSGSVAAGRRSSFEHLRIKYPFDDYWGRR
jgi:hypothetical protein